ncbi:MAG: hypothetical protein ACYTXT_42700 [Nostoc sp.]
MGRIWDETAQNITPNPALEPFEHVYQVRPPFGHGGSKDIQVHPEI